MAGMIRLPELIVWTAAFALAQPALGESVRIGTFEIELTPPAGWTVTKRPLGDSQFHYAATGPTGSAGKVILTVVRRAEREPVTQARVREVTLAVGSIHVSGSVEQKATLREFELAQGVGAYCVFTDASLVGKPTTPTQYRVMASGIVQLNEEVMIGATILCNDEKSPEFAACLAMIAGITIRPAAPPLLAR